MHKQLIPSKGMDSSSPIVRVGRNFQVTIPAEIRKFVPLADGDYIKTSISHGQIIFSPVTMIEKRSSEDADEQEWDMLMLGKFLSGYAETDSVYDNL